MLTGRQLSNAGTAKAAMVAINHATAPAAMTGHCSCGRAGSGGGSTVFSSEDIVIQSNRSTGRCRLPCRIVCGVKARTAHPVDGRQVLVSVSDAGVSHVESERRASQEWLRLDSLNQDERATLLRAADLMSTIVDESA